jgi:hypothetical protein
VREERLSADDLKGRDDSTRDQLEVLKQKVADAKRYEELVKEQNRMGQHKQSSVINQSFRMTGGD